MFFKDVSLVHHKSQLRFRLIHFWEAWNPVKNTLIGLEMLLIDEQGTDRFFNGPVMKLYLWDQVARDFCIKFKSYGKTPTVLLVT
ncbi:BnaAnng30150D, partial [Brassica napus]